MIHENTHLVFHFIRHGESEYNRKPWLIGGRSPEASLSARGLQQTKQLGERLLQEKLEIDYLFSSPLPRAIETSQSLCSLLGYPFAQVEHIEELTELSQGAWEGCDRKEIYSTEKLHYINTKGFLFVPPEGESQRMVQRRVSSWLEDRILYDATLTETDKPINIVIVSHAITLKCLFHYILGFNDRMIYRLQLDNCSLSRFIYKREGWFMHSLNDAYHLAPIGRLSGEYTGI